MTARSKLEPSGATPPETLGDILFADRTTPPSESEWLTLVRSIAARDQSALHALFQRIHRLVFTLIMRITRNAQTAEELMLDVFHDVWRHAPAYDTANGSVVGWVMNMARSRAIDRLRFEQRKKRVDRHAHSPDPAADGGASGPHEVLALQEQEQQLRDALGTLTPDERQAIEVAFFSGLSHAETAARLGLPLGTVKSRIRSGLSKLRQSLVEGWSR